MRRWVVVACAVVLGFASVSVAVWCSLACAGAQARPALVVRMQKAVAARPAKMSRVSPKGVPTPAEAPKPLGVPTSAEAPPKSVGPPADSGNPRGVPPRKPASLVEELVGVLDQTTSRQTFLVTLAVLRDLGQEAKPAVAAILRNADRLKLFADEDSVRCKQAAADVLSAIKEILRTEAMPPMATTS
jgi:hypothetical protein